MPSTRMAITHPRSRRRRNFQSQATVVTAEREEARARERDDDAAASSPMVTISSVRRSGRGRVRRSPIARGTRRFSISARSFGFWVSGAS